MMMGARLVILWISVLILGVGAAENDSSSILNETAVKKNAADGPTKFSRKQLSAIAKDFTSYYLYFGQTTDTIKNNGGIEMSVCFAPSFNNATHKLLSESLHGSVRRNYIPRILSRSQVSWKTKLDDKPKKVADVNATQSAAQNETSVNGTVPNAADTKLDTEQEEGDRNNRIHKHLIFTVLLPHHPYSQEVRKIITTVAPMYPQTTTVLGNAYEFKDMTSKYMVNSYPKILYFKNGMYVESYEGEYTPELVAAKFTEWTNALPKAIPMPFAYTLLAEKTPKHVREFDIYAPGANMRSGLSLQPLPLTAQYVVLNVTLPEWVVPFIPGVSYLNNSRLIEQAAVSLAAQSSAHKESTAASVSTVNTSASSLQAVSSVDSNVVTENEHSSESASGEESVEEQQGGAPQCACETCADNTGAIDSAPSTASVVEADGTTTVTSSAPVSADSPAVDPTVVAEPSESAAAAAATSDATTTAAPAGVPLVVSITVPMPNMEPFLGSIENYAVWDTRVFLLAGLYTIARFIYAVHKWFRAGR